MHDGSWYPARIIRFEGETVVASRTQKTGDAPQTLRVTEDEIRVIAEKNFGNY